MGGLKIPKYKEMSMKHKLNVYNKTEKVYIPLEYNDNETSTILVKKDDYVFKGSLLGKRKGRFRSFAVDQNSNVYLDLIL